MEKAADKSPARLQKAQAVAPKAHHGLCGQPPGQEIGPVFAKKPA